MTIFFLTVPWDEDLGLSHHPPWGCLGIGLISISPAEWMDGQKGEEADHLCLGSQAQERNSDHYMCDTPLCPPLDVPCSCMIRLFLEEKDFEFNRDAIWTEINAWDAAPEEISAVSLNLWKVPNALKLFIHLRVLSKCNPNCFRLAEAGSFSSFPVYLKKNCLFPYQVYLFQPVARLLHLCQAEILKLILLVDGISVLRTCLFWKMAARISLV